VANPASSTEMRIFPPLNSGAANGAPIRPTTYVGRQPSCNNHKTIDRMGVPDHANAPAILA
jgi:hypothetical protein